MNLKMTDKEIVKEYLLTAYCFSSSENNWVARHKTCGSTLISYNLVSSINRIFPDMGGYDVCMDWFEDNINFVQSKLRRFLDKFRLTDGGVGTINWVVINHYGRIFKEEEILVELMLLLPTHHSWKMVKKVYDSWFEDMKFKECEKMFGK